MANIKVINREGQEVEGIKLNEKLFDGSINKPLLNQAVTMYLANQRVGSAKTKNRGDVSGGGKKPWRQKGTGRARAGSIRSPLWRGGGVVFGPIPKNWHYKLPKQMRNRALLSSLNAKIHENNLVVIDQLNLESHKTKELAGILKKINLNAGKIFIVSEQAYDNLKKAARNIEKVSLASAQDINAYQILVSDKVLLERGALKKIEKMLEKAVW